MLLCQCRNGDGKFKFWWTGYDFLRHLARRASIGIGWSCALIRTKCASWTGRHYAAAANGHVSLSLCERGAPLRLWFGPLTRRRRGGRGAHGMGGPRGRCEMLVRGVGEIAMMAIRGRDRIRGGERGGGEERRRPALPCGLWAVEASKARQGKAGHQVFHVHMGTHGLAWSRGGG